MNKRFPKFSLLILLAVIAACALADYISPFEKGVMDVSAVNVPPSSDHIFGTDTLGRDIFSMVLFGGRASVYIGLLSGLISATIAVIYGTAAGIAGKKTDDLMMRFAELLMSIPSILLVIFLQGIWGDVTYTSLALAIALTSWMNISKVVRSEVRQIRNSDYVLEARTLGAGFMYILRRHLLPNFISSIMFMVVTNMGKAMITESTLSFLGIGLPLTTVSWGSLMSISQDALLSESWWIIVIPGSVLVITLVCITQLGEYIRIKNNKLYSNL